MNKSDKIKYDEQNQDDADIRVLLEDAYRTPLPPRSLEGRLAQQVAQEWGADGTVCSSRAISSTGRSTSRFVSSRYLVRYAASVVLLVGLVLFIQGTGPAYGWASVVRAMTGQPVVQLQDTADVSAQQWFSVGEKFLIEKTATQSQLVKLEEGVALRYAIDESVVKRFSLADNPKRSQPEHVVMRSLTGMDVATDFRVSGERWTRSGDHVNLNFQVQNGGETLQMNLKLNPQNHLPITAEVYQPGRYRRTVKVEYPKTSTADLVAAAIPAGLPMVAADDNISQTAIAQIDGKLAEPTELAANTDATSADFDETKTTVLKGAASLGWKPITVNQFGVEQAVDEINETLTAVWGDHGIEPTATAADEELLRRLYLDLTGRTPTVTEVRNYLNDTSDDRYKALVSRLLGSRDHATHLATVWRNFLLPEGVDLSKFGGVTAFDEWLSEKFSKNVPYDQLVRELLLAEGRLSKSGPLLFYSSLKLDADQLAARTARVFLGMRLDCAQCHDDPFEPWTQQDFWSYAAFFAQISRPQAELEAVSTVMQVRDVDRGEVMMPDTEDPIPPRYLDGTQFEKTTARRQHLAQWLTSRENPYFARAAVNRVWALMFGKGIVDPVDGFGRRYEPASPELLDLLAGQFVGSEFNIRTIFESIAKSDAYRLSSGATNANSERSQYFAQMNVKTFTAEQVYDCISVATMLGNSTPSGDFLNRFGNTSRDEFLTQFKTSTGKITQYQGGIPQALTLMNGGLIGSATGISSSGLLKSLDAPFFTDRERVEVLYLATLSRKPTNSEWDILTSYLKDRPEGTSVQEPLADILWSLLNSAEFTMNH